MKKLNRLANWVVGSSKRLYGAVAICCIGDGLSMYCLSDWSPVGAGIATAVLTAACGAVAIRTARLRLRLE